MQNGALIGTWQLFVEFSRELDAAEAPVHQAKPVIFQAEAVIFQAEAPVD